MKKIYTLSLTLLFSYTLQAQVNDQPIRFAKGDLTTGSNISRKTFSIKDIEQARFNDVYYVLVQFSKLPSASRQQELERAGIKLYNFFPGKAYLASISKDFDLLRAAAFDISSINIFPGFYKTDSRLSDPASFEDKNNERLIAVSIYPGFDKTIAVNELIKLHASIVQTKFTDANTIFIHCSKEDIPAIAALPFVYYINLQTIKDKLLNYLDIGTHAVTSLLNPAGRKLDGRGVTVGVGDNADASTHLDFTGRLVNRVFYYPDYHGTHTTGTVGGGGLINQKHHGMAPKAQIVSQWFSDILTNTPTYVTDYNLVATNNSYYSSEPNCPGNSQYDVLSNYIDAQAKAYPQVLHVIAAGNDGLNTCSPYPNSFATIKSGWQTAKNVITVGNIVGATYALGFASSKGPVSDGRIKPEIMANGTNTYSTYINNTYGYNSGTSMAAPAVTGVLALLQQRYRQLNGSNANSALLKAVLCNGAEDLGIPGPDYTYGFGFMNARNAVEALETNRYYLDSLATGTYSQFNISVPAGAKRLRVMLCYTDKEAAANAAIALVNDLDLTVTNPSSVVYKPLTLNSAPGNINDTAIQRRDSLNNIEQVIITNPAAGTYSLKVTGYAVPFGPQYYALTYQIDMPSVTVEYPYGGEIMVPGESEVIRWTGYGNEGNDYTVEYSNDGGSNWLSKDTVAASLRNFSWTVPSTPTNNGLIRVSRLGTALNDVSNYPFVILGQPSVNASLACPGYANLNWVAVPSATSYDIYQLKGDSMTIIGNTTDTFFLVSGLNKYKDEWLAVAAKNGSSSGRRSIAVDVVANSGTCSLATFDNDLVVDSILEPNTARQAYPNSADATKKVKIRIKNLGSVTASGPYTVDFSYQNSIMPAETINTNIPPGGTIDYTFVGDYPFPPEGFMYNFKAWVTKTADNHHDNDTAYKISGSINNDPVAPPFVQNFEAFGNHEYNVKQVGLIGGGFFELAADKFDFLPGSVRSRARTFVNTGFAHSGTHAITLDQRPNGATTSDTLVLAINGTFFGAGRMEFWYKNHGQANLAGNKVWMRANINEPWVMAYDLYANQAGINEWKIARINIPDVLVGIPPTATFQVKFGQEGNTSANSVVQTQDYDDGYTFDDIAVYYAQNDVALQQVVSPDKKGCGLGTNTPVTISIKNYEPTAVSNVKVSYRINGGAVVTDSIPTIAGNTTVQYSFPGTVDLSAFIDYSCDFWINASADTYKGNDSILNYTFHNSPSISSFPYLEGFESNDGYWYVKGNNTSWQWGTPAKTIINKAANGNKAWVTGLSTNYRNDELSYLYSPCFNLSGLTQPVLSFSHIYQLEDNCPCDYTWVEYSTDGGLTWQKLGAVGQGTNWFTDATTQTFKTSKTKWHVASIDVPTQSANTRFRFVMFADGGVTYEGAGIDDVHVFDKQLIYTGAAITSGLSQTVNTNGWIHFNDPGGKRVASINSFGQNLGLTDVQVFPRTGPVRYSNNYFYADRNIVIQPANQPTGNVGVRFYFTDTEAKNLIAANNCASCIKPADPYELGVTKYNYSPAEEDSTLANDTSGLFTFISPAATAIIPYDNGYYAEYNVSSFSEFWLGLGNINPAGKNNCPGDTLSFAVTFGAGTYQWQEDTGSGFVNVSNGADYSGATTYLLKVFNKPTSTTGYKYRCLINGSPSAEFTLRFLMTWNGSVSTDWFNPSNWSCSSIPDQYTDVIIPGGLSNYPVVNSNAAVRSVKAFPGVQVTVVAGVMLDIKGR